MENKIKDLISKMTLEEKISFCSGADDWHTQGVERLGIPEIMMSDGPHGLRKREKDENGQYYTVKSTCFPPASAMANSWDEELVERVGTYLGKECRAEQVSILLGPGMNIKRSPTCGRNFEYYSEDPLLSGKMAAGLIRGIQGQGVAACAKHFFVNNQETRRFSTSANLSERALHEVYLPSFEMAVKEADVKTVMHSYNRVNGRYAGENKELINGTLRAKWGFDGYVMSDWKAISDRVAAYHAGADVEMPPSNGVRDAEVLAAYKRGEVTMEEIDESVANVLRVVFGFLPAAEKGSFDEHHRAAAEAVEGCIVLLKNENKVLPFAKGEPLAVIGGFAKKPRFQGGGSSHVEPIRVDDITEYIVSENGCDIVYADGYDEKHNTNDELIAEAVSAAKECGRAVIFAGMPESYETEGRDRRHMRMPESHNRLIEEVCAVCDKVAVVLMAGSPNEMPWADKAPSILHAYLGGQALGSGVAKILFGTVNPSGKLAETYPIHFEDNPAYLNFPGDGDECLYGEDIYVGYKWYDARKMEVLFPFGHGLSYTEFEYSDIVADRNTVTVNVKNVGDRDGKEVVQLYAHALPHPEIDKYIGESSFCPRRPVKWLCGFKKIDLKAGESKTVTFELCDRMFSIYDEKAGDFRKVSGDYEMLVGTSSRDLPVSAVISVEEDDRVAPVLNLNTAIEEVLLEKRIPAEVAEELLEKVIGDDLPEGEGLNVVADTAKRKLRYVLRQYVDFRRGGLTTAEVQQYVDEANEKIRKAYEK